MNSALLGFMFILMIFLMSGLRNRSRIRSDSDYFYGDRKLNWFGFAVNAFGTNFSFISASFVLLFWSYNYGLVPMLWTIGTGIAGILLFSVRRIGLLKRGELFRSSTETLHHFISRDDGFLRGLAGATTAITLIGYLVGESFIFAQFASPFFGIHPAIIIVAVFSVTIVNTWLGGYNAAVKSDYFQVGIIAVGSIFLFAMIWANALTSKVSLMDISYGTTFTSTPAFFIAMLVLVNGMSQFSAMDMWQRAKATGDSKEVERGGIAGSFIFAIVTFAIVGIGMIFRYQDIAAGHLEGNPFELLGRLINFSSPYFGGYVLLFYFLCAYLTTLDSIYIALSSTVSLDVVRTKDLRKTRVLTLVLGVAVAAVSVGLSFIDSGAWIVNFLITLFSISILLTPTIIFRSFLWRFELKTYAYKTSIIAGLLAGVGALVYTAIRGDMDANFVTVISFFVSWLGLLIVAPFAMKRN